MPPRTLKFALSATLLLVHADPGLAVELFQPFGYARHAAFEKASHRTGGPNATLNGSSQNDSEAQAINFWDVGFGSVAVNYDLPAQNFVTGYRDYYDNTAGAASVTTVGPITYVGNTGSEFTDINVVDETFIDHGGLQPETEPSDRLADDINGNGSGGFTYILADIDGDGSVGAHEVVGVISNFDDLHTFNVFHDTVTVRHATTPTSFEVMKQHVLFAPEGTNTLGTGWRFDSFFDDWSLGFGDEVRGGWEINAEMTEPIRYGLLREAIEATRLSAYGAAGIRGMRIEDDFSFEGIGSILGRTMVATSIDHDLFGPQVGVGVVAEASMLRFEAVVLGLIGYGHAEIKQTGVFSDDVIPGALNRPATARTTTSSAPKVTDGYFAWQGETRLTASCQLTQSLRFDAMWRGVLTGPVRSAADATAWNAPDFGIRDIDGETIDFNHWFFGLTYTR